MNRNSILGTGLALIVSALTLPASAQQNAKPADFSGVWLMEGGGGAEVKGKSAFNTRMQSQWVEGTLPFNAKGLAQYQSNKPGKGPRMVKPVFGNDPIGGANPVGLYRALIYSRPFEIEQVPGKIIQLFSYGRIFRIIYTDGRPVPADIPEGPVWYGYSVGHWEGDTLVVNTLALDGRAWMDEYGTPLSDDARVEERWKRTSHDRLQMTITVTDPSLYSKPWTSAPLIYTLKPRQEPNEIIFAPMDESAFNRVVRDPAGSPDKPAVGEGSTK
jgi:hypothetical protein